MDKNIFSKVLFIGPKNEFGGIGSVLKVYFNFLKKYNYIISHYDTNKLFNVFVFITAFIKLNIFLLLEPEIKIIHIHSASKGSFIRKILFGLTGKLWKRKVIIHMHSGSFQSFYNKSKIQKNIIVHLMSKMDVVICLSQLWKNVFYSDLKLNNLKVIANPVEKIEIINHKHFDESLELFFLGNICEEKGILDFIKYLSTNLYFLDRKIKLFIGGVGDVNKLQQLISIVPIQNQIVYLGWLDFEKKQYYYQKHCDVFVLPSYKEGLPMSILEAMSYGKPIISTKVGGIPSLVLDRYNGWLFNPGYFVQLDQIFDEIFNAKKHFEYFQNNSLEFAKNYTPENIMSQLQDCYYELLSV